MRRKVLEIGECGESWNKLLRKVVESGGVWWKEHVTLRLTGLIE